jgi:hypothetical protein
MNYRIFIRIVACFAIATGVFVVVRDLGSYIHLVSLLGNSVESMGLLLTTLGVILMMIPVFKVAVGIGLFQCKSWAWLAAIIVLTADFLFRAQGAVRIFLNIMSGNIPIQVVVDVGRNPDVRYLSVWPSYIIAVISAVSLGVLVNKSIKKVFTSKVEASGELE